MLAAANAQKASKQKIMKDEAADLSFSRERGFRLLNIS
jgi:hypothetical protein